MQRHPQRAMAWLSDAQIPMGEKNHPPIIGFSARSLEDKPDHA